MSDELALLKRKLEREKKARKAAESTLEEKSLQLFRSNERLKTLNSSLESQIEEQTRDIKASESRFRTIVETASDIIYRIDDYGVFTYANPIAIEKMGFSMEELSKMHFTDLIAPYAKEEVDQFYMHQFEQKIEQTYTEVPVVTKAGQTLWLGQNVIYVYNPDGSVLRVSAVARDITDSKVSKTRLENLISSLQSGVLLEDENRKIALSNNNFCELFGIPATPDQLQGQDCSNSAEESKMLFKDEAAFLKRIDEVLKDRKEVLGDELLLKDGRIFERDYIPIFVDNHYSGHLWNYRDVSTQRTYVDAIQRSEEKYRSIIENMNLGMLEVDVHERIRYANQSFCEMSGYDLDEILGKNAKDLFVQGDHAAVMEEKNGMRSHGISDAYEIATKNKRGEAKWWLISGAPLIDDLGDQQGSIGIHLDITDQKMLEQQLLLARNAAQESAHSKEVFLANMSHEIRTPMNGIVGMTRELAKTKLDDPQLFYLNTIRAAADNLLVILNDILDLSKIEAGKLSIEKEPFELLKTIEQACRVMKPKAEEKGLELSVKSDRSFDSPFIGDAHRLNQILLNLVGNAVKFTKKGGVSVTASTIKSQDDQRIVQLRVKDSGIGMDKDYVEQIFDPFSQEDGSTARKFGGTGLGMNITKQLVSLMDGSIRIESEKGKGTEVIIELPFQETPSDFVMNVEMEDKPYLELLGGKRVLIAEDNELNRLVIESALRHYRVILQFAVNGKEAIELLSGFGADLVLMDVQMPVMDGLEATAYIRDELKSQIPIIALTANVLSGDRDRYIAAGMDDTIPKPFEEHELLDTMVKWVDPASKPSRVATTERAVINVEKPQAGPKYSLAKLEQISQGDTVFINRMIGIFCDQSEEASELMRTAMEKDDLDTIWKLAHKMKPSIDNLAITALFDEVRELEKLARAGENLERVKALVEIFCEELDSVRAEIEEVS